MCKDIILNRIFGGQEIIIGTGREPQVVAEAGVLTFGEKETAFRFIDEAKKIGVKLLKFQCIAPENVISEEDKHWLERIKQRALSKADFLEAMAYGKKNGIVCFASTHNEYDLVDLAKEDMQILKIGSGDSNNYRMIDMALSTEKPVILSLGLMKKEEIFKLLERYKNFSNQLVIMHCTTIYPTPPDLANLDLIKQIDSRYPQYNFGYSDHVAGYNVALAASSMKEVVIIEKHICLPEHRIKPKYDSMDIPVALTPSEFQKMLVGIKEIYWAVKQFKENNEMFVHEKWARKAICARRDIGAGEILQPDDLMSIRPFIADSGHLPIGKFYDVVGKKVGRDIKKGEHILFKDIT